ncbi:MAG: UPF0104 family protein [Desulfobacteraceae bacterium]|nr:MAG: UPF0104 family protein [Desulfobacteraceae bacterium]
MNEKKSFFQNMNRIPSSVRKIFLLLCKFLFAIIILLILQRYDILQIDLLEDLFRRPLLLSGLVLYIGSTFFLCALRWQMLMKIQNIEVLFSHVFSAVYVSAFVSLFLPGAISGDVVRTVIGLKFNNNQKLNIALSVIMDRLIGMMGLVTLGFFAGVFICFTKKESSIILINICMIFFFIIILFLMISFFSKRILEIMNIKNWNEKKSIYQLIHKAVNALAVYGRSPKSMMHCWGISVIVHAQHLTLLLACGIIIGMSGVESSLYAFAGVVAFIINFLPVTPGGLGVGEITFSHVIEVVSSHTNEFQAYGSMMLAYRSVLALSLVPALLFLFQTYRLFRKMEK